MSGAAGVALLGPGGVLLFVLRSSVGDHPGEWCFPGGGIEEGETPETAARRELREEVGLNYTRALIEIGSQALDAGGRFTTFVGRSSELFRPTLNEEHTAYAWAPPDAPPGNLHPGVRETLTMFAADSAEWKEGEHPRREDGKFGAGGGGGGSEGGEKKEYTPEQLKRIATAKEWDKLEEKVIDGEKLTPEESKKLDDFRLNSHNEPSKEDLAAHSHYERTHGGLSAGGEGGGTPEPEPERPPPFNDGELSKEEIDSIYSGDPHTVLETAKFYSTKSQKSEERINELSYAINDHASEIESAEQELSEITDEDRAGLEEGEEFVAEQQLAEARSEAAFKTYVARETLVDHANNVNSVLGLDNIEHDDSFNPDDLTAKEANKIHEILDAAGTEIEDLGNAYRDRIEDLEGAADDEDVDFDDFIASAGEVRKAALELHSAIAKIIKAVDKAAGPANKRREKLDEQQAMADLKAKGTDGASDHALAFDRATGGQIATRTKRIGLAFDRATVRSYDADGRLRIAITNISKANICPYVGKEIPGHVELGLDPEKVYQLLRAPEELARAAPTFRSVPLLSEHKPVSSEDHQPDLVIGATGSDSEFQDPYLRVSLVVWEKDAIDGIESDEKKELSSSYRYRADMTPGTYKGESYDGVMRDIIGNHVALVEEGRAGTDVVVGDSKKEFRRMAKGPLRVLSTRVAITMGALLGHVSPLLAKDAGIDWKPVLSALRGKDFNTRKAAVVAELRTQTKDKLAKDASIDGVAKLLDMIEGSKPAGVDIDPPALADPDTVETQGLDGFLKGKLSQDDYASAMKMMGKGSDEDPDADATKEAEDEDKDADTEKDKAQDDPPDFKGSPKTGASVTKKAMDAAINTAVQAAAKNAGEIRDAERYVRPWVGDLAVAFDSAAKVYEHALGVAGIKTEGVHPSAFRTILETLPKPGSRKVAEASVVALDAAAQKSFAERFPGAARIRTV